MQLHYRRASAVAAAIALLLGGAAAAQDHDHASELPYRSDGHMMITPDELAWGNVASMAPPEQIAVIEGDLGAEEPFTFRLLLPDGYEVLPHVHPEYERVTVISGTFHFAHGEEFDAGATRALTPGSVAIMAPGEPMFGQAEGDTVIQLHGTGPGESSTFVRKTIRDPDSHLPTAFLGFGYAVGVTSLGDEGLEILRRQKPRPRQSQELEAQPRK